jgi:hypothetical protein
MENNDALTALAQAISPYLDGQKRFGGFTPYGMKASGTPSENAYLYENGGLFGRCDGPSQLINALVGPIGFEKVLSWVGTDTENEFVDAWTAIAETGSEQSTSCGDCISISLQACAQLYCFGRFCRQTQELQFDRLGVRGNANVPTKALFGSVTDATGNVLVAQGSQINDAFLIQSRAVGYALRFKNSSLLWSGNPVNNNGRVYEEYSGFQLLVNSGKFDAYTQNDCDALDSFLLNYSNNAIQSDGALAITDYFRRVVLELMRRAGGAGLDWDSATMYIVMTPNMWDGVAKRYACAGIDLCALSGNNTRAVANADQAQARYEEYLTRMALPIYGRWYPVVIDSQIPETTGQPNGVCSDIYFITTSINGEEITFGQYQDFNMTYGRTRQEMVSMFGSDDIAITDNGRFALVRDNSRGCFDVQAYTKPRIVMKAPFLAGRIQNVCHDILGGPVADVTLSGSVYEKAGGRSITSPPTLYGPCVDC